MRHNEKPPITLKKLHADLGKQVAGGTTGRWRAFSEFVILAHYWLPNKHQHDSVHAHIRWAADQMDQLEKGLASPIEEESAS